MLKLKNFTRLYISPVECNFTLYIEFCAIKVSAQTLNQLGVSTASFVSLIARATNSAGYRVKNFGIEKTHLRNTNA